MCTVSGCADCVCSHQVHFWALPKTGDRADAFVPVEFTKPYMTTLLNHPDYDVRPPPPSLPPSLFFLPLPLLPLVSPCTLRTSPYLLSPSCSQLAMCSYVLASHVVSY